ncbi:hypothetical protein A374_03044 [Fictibacillus macauensis ZFHKF-1]|uniref:Uncharacterized protein n=1 Tax=Fictibacillus macauensis ZFHKF-1 TaxID=1196324 RepID=I8UI72_9BACL|nr:hypothetical protein [Fictibacillus macauensis]EIT86513.1 hypothetical protein A374_03044 [Fictibacillus macauensis ZFHKF-1]
MDIKQEPTAGINGAYRGMAYPIPFSCSENAAFILRNPKNSNTLVTLRRIRVANLSSTGIQIIITLLGTPSGRLFRSDYVIGPLETPNRLTSTGIYYGNNIEIKEGVPVITIAVPPYSTWDTVPLGKAVFPPGTNHIATITPIETNGTGCVNASYDWQEEPVLTTDAFHTNRT